MLCRKEKDDHVTLHDEERQNVYKDLWFLISTMASRPTGMPFYTQSIMFPPYFSILTAAMVACALQVTLADKPSPNIAYINYTTITGYFLQDEPSTNSTAFDFMTTNVRFLLSLNPHLQPSPRNMAWGRWIIRMS